MMRRTGRVILFAIVVGVISGGGAGCQSKKRMTPMRDAELARRENERAIELTDNGKYDEAERVLRKAMKADVMFGPVRNNLGLVYYHQGKLYEAAWEFQNAIKLMPHQPEPRNNLGLVLEKAGKLDDAEASYRKARELEPDNPEYIGNLARTRVRRGQRDEETRELLEELVLKDSRPPWLDWAKLNLFRIPRPPSEPAATTRPVQEEVDRSRR
ncbi:MAG: tetratricopeptide repeat protein [Tepidisphaeraceae bacterium]